MVSNGKPNPNPPRPNPKAPPRSATPSQRPTISSTQSTKTTKVTPIVNQKLATNISSNKQTNATTTPSKFTNQREFIIIIQFNKIQNQSKTKEAIVFTKCDEGSKSKIQAKEYKIKFYTLFRFLFIMSVKFE